MGKSGLCEKLLYLSAQKRIGIEPAATAIFNGCYHIERHIPRKFHISVMVELSVTFAPANLIYYLAN
jgi:hypothetical protein